MITFITKPDQFSPVNNPVAFGISGSSNDLVFFRVEIKEAKTNTTIYTGNVYPTPVNPQLVYFNADKQLSSLVASEVDLIPDCFVIGKQNNVIAYNLFATEYGVTGGTISALGLPVSASSGYFDYTGLVLQPYQGFYAWESDLDISGQIFYHGYDWSIVQISGESRPTDFLTYQPNYEQGAAKVVNNYSVEQLYWLSNKVDIFNVHVSNNRNGLSSATTYNNYLEGSESVNEVRATARVTITGSAGIRDNIAISGSNGIVYGSYSATTTGLTTSQLAEGLRAAIVANPNSTGFGVIRTSNVIDITAPVGLGSTGNCTSTPAYCLSAGINATTGITITGVSSVTSVTSTTAVHATAILSGFSAPSSAGVSVNVTSNDSPLGTITMGSYTTQASDIGNLSLYIIHLASAVNSDGTYDYSANIFNSTALQITAPVLPNAAGYNGTHATLDGTYNGTFGGGVNVITGYSITVSTTGTTISNFNIIPNTVTGFAGGQDAIAGFTGSSYNARMFSVGVDPTAISNTTNDSVNFWDLGLSFGDTYSVWVTDQLGNQISSTMYYSYQDTECNVDLVNILYENSMGGVDAIQMVAPSETVSSTKLSIQKNNLSLDLKYTDSNCNINPTTQNYFSNNKAVIKAWTKHLTDTEAFVLIDLLKSKNIYFVNKLRDRLIPVTLVTSSYNPQKKKYIGNNINQYSFEFDFPLNYIPFFGWDNIIAND